MLAAWAAAAALLPVHAAYSDCRDCHIDVTPGDGTPDYSGYFAVPGHHPVRVSYPATAEYHVPSATRSNIRFVDRNRNGRTDPDEIQIFRSGNGWLIDCASCHIEHGTTPPNHPPDYVRGCGGASSLLCQTCHNL